MTPRTLSGPERGFTLIELLLALTLVAALLAITFGSLRVGLAAWRRGEERAEAQQHGRGLVQVLARGLGATHPYQGEARAGSQPPILFEGEAERLSFVTATPPFPATGPIAFTAVQLAVDDGEAPGLALRQKALPNTDPFERVAPVLVDGSVTAVTFRYLRDAPGSWEERWDAATEQRLPRAVELTITTSIGGREVEHPPLTVSIPAGTQ